MDLKEEIVWRKIFFKDNFNIDQCLSKYTKKTDLETLRNELKSYGNELHKQMADILKTETEAIVNLAEYLTNLNSKIENLSIPISQLQEEVKTMYELIKLAHQSFENTLESTKKNNMKSINLRLKLTIFNCTLYIDNLLKSNCIDSVMDISNLERAVNTYSFQKNYLHEMGIMSSDIEHQVEQVENKLAIMVNNAFLSGIRSRNESVILKCLYMYENLGKPHEAEETLRFNITRPALKLILSEKNLEMHHQNLENLFEEAMQVMEVNLCDLVNIVKKNAELRVFNFILNSFWLEVDKQLRECLPHITAPGNPELFQKRYQSTWKFCEKLLLYSEKPNLIKNNPTLRDHLKRFNLPVYFEIKYQHIAGNFEHDMLLKSASEIYAPENEICCNLQTTYSLWSCMSNCFSDTIFIETLADQFLKLSMLLLSRYLTSFDTAFLEYEKDVENKHHWNLFVINSLLDLNIISSLIGTNSDDMKVVDDTIYRITPQFLRPSILKIIKMNYTVIQKKYKQIENHLIKVKSDDCITKLQNVGAIPRLYRRTNKSVPKEASSYILEAVQPLIIFYSEFESVLKEKIEHIINAIIKNVTEQYLLLVQQVLKSVCKTEESLRRLKNRNVGVNEDGSGSASDTMSDEMKIREQIKLDVLYFVDKLYSIVNHDTKNILEDLKKETRLS